MAHGGASQRLLLQFVQMSGKGLELGSVLDALRHGGPTDWAP